MSGRARPPNRYDVDAKQNEIAVRYRAKRKRAWNAMPRVEQIIALRRGQLRRLMAVRSGCNIMGELDDMIEGQAGVGWEILKPVEISHRLNISLREKMQLDLRNFPASDVSKEQQAAMLRAARKKRNAERMRRKRQPMEATMQMINDLSVRDEALHALLKGHRKWQTIRWMMRKLEGLPAFKRPDGKALRGISLKSRVHEACNRLVAAGLVEKKSKPMRRVIRALFRWKSDRTTVQPYRNRVRARENPHGIGTTSLSALTSAHACAHDSYCRERTHSLREQGVAERQRSPVPIETDTTNDVGGKTVH